MVMKGSDKTLSPFAAPSETRSSFRQALPQILAVCVKNVLLLGFGMTLGFPTILIPSLSGHDPNEPISLGQEAISWIGSINLICVPIGCLMSGAITQPIGRKRAMQLVNIPFLTAWLLFYFSKEVWQIFLALAITGVTGGLLEAPTLTYVAEVTQPNLRGIMQAVATISVISGILIQFLLGTFFHWRTAAISSCIAPLVATCLLSFIPESHHWLISKDRIAEARRSLAWLRGWASEEETQAEFKELYDQIHTETETKALNWGLYTRKSFIWPFSLTAFTFLLGHFSGMTTLETYAVEIFSTLKSPIDEYYATVFLGIAEVLGCVLCGCLIHFVGKRVVTFISLIGCGCCFFGFASYIYFFDDVKNFDTVPEGNKNESNWLPTALLVLSACFTHTGIRILPWMLVGEVYSNDTRAPASGMSAALNYVIGFTSNKTFLKMVSVITIPGTYWFYSGVSFIGCIVLYFILPETEGKPLFEITQHFAGKGKLDNHVYKEKKTIPNGQVNYGFVSEESESK